MTDANLPAPIEDSQHADLPLFPEYKREAVDEILQRIAEPWNSHKLNEAIDQFRIGEKKRQDELVILAAQAILVCLEHGDIHPARKLLQAVPRQYLYLRRCLLNHGPFMFDSTTLKDYVTGATTKARGIVLDKTRFRELRGKYRGGNDASDGDPQKSKRLFARKLAASLLKEKVKQQKVIDEFDFVKEFEAFIKKVERRHKKSPSERLGIGLQKSQKLLEELRQ
jgi:hypothetical protein